MKSKLGLICFVIAVLSTAILFAPAIAHAQAYPTFTSGLKLSNTLHRSSSTVGASPALAEFNNVLYMAYADSSSGDLDIAVSTDGLHFGSPIYRGPYIGVDNTPSITVFGNELVVAYTSTKSFMSPLRQTGRIG